MGLWLLGVYCLYACKNDQQTGNNTPQSLIATDTKAIDAKASFISDDNVKADTVYVCQSTGATKFHYNSNCHALKRCKHNVATMKRKEAENLGLGLCGFEGS